MFLPNHLKITNQGTYDFSPHFMVLPNWSQFWAAPNWRSQTPELLAAATGHRRRNLKVLKENCNCKATQLAHGKRITLYLSDPKKMQTICFFWPRNLDVSSFFSNVFYSHVLGFIWRSSSLFAPACANHLDNLSFEAKVFVVSRFMAFPISATWFRYPQRSTKYGN